MFTSFRPSGVAVRVADEDKMTDYGRIARPMSLGEERRSKLEPATAKQGVGICDRRFADENNAKHGGVGEGENGAM